MDPFIDVPADSASVEPRPHWALVLPWEAFAKIMVMLRAGLPALVGEAAGDWVRRDQTAMAGVGRWLRLPRRRGGWRLSS